MDTEQPQSDADGMQAEGAADMNATVLYENIPVGPPRVASDSEGRQCYWYDVVVMCMNQWHRSWPAC